MGRAWRTRGLPTLFTSLSNAAHPAVAGDITCKNMYPCRGYRFLWGMGRGLEGLAGFLLYSVPALKLT